MNSKIIRVLLIEDNPSDARLIQEALSAPGEASFDLEAAETLAAGLERLSAGGIDAMLLDLALPDSLGWTRLLGPKHMRWAWQSSC